MKKQKRIPNIKEKSDKTQFKRKQRRNNGNLPASTPAIPAPNDVTEEDDDEPPLNENDDDELGDVDQGEELNTQHLVLVQFDF
ncbi:hypothetical protein L484_025299 [Morus notabilis]|uniref:Uncharacterized protein n=1 Tax=Morus notabilis TaxID=981085 RepID=W9RUJ1_9ROSA|nr:hypothetical protein L484_025299 [Morus notabilis]